MQAGAAYATARKRLIELMTAASPDERDQRVPACPDWRTRDVLAHVVGIAVDTLDGQIAGAGTEEWTERQVDERRDRSVEDLVSEWEGVADRLDAALDTFHPAIAGGFIGDLVTHEQDVRGALGKPGGRDDEAFEIALDSYVRFFGRRIKENDLPGLVVRSEGREWTLGKNDVVGELSGDPFEVLRSLTGRRTLDQVRALQWTTDPEPFLPIVSMYGIPAAPLSE
ncbi:MAG TPA: maleylpyruvate isomerase family mycothiol-dependent enzyme [Actinomycetota bacterium]|nr:maleylpyruvate isomerase family mycothiol-dependent enzyme [Actinomycetota bacterium]